MVFYEHEPWGYEAEERRHAQLLATMFNSVPKPRGVKGIDWQEFYRDPWGDSQIEQQKFTPEQRAFLEKRKAARKRKQK